jgi:hypothetical protein
MTTNEKSNEPVKEAPIVGLDGRTREELTLTLDRTYTQLNPPSRMVDGEYVYDPERSITMFLSQGPKKLTLSGIDILGIKTLLSDPRWAKDVETALAIAKASFNRTMDQKKKAQKRMEKM